MNEGMQLALEIAVLMVATSLSLELISMALYRFFRPIMIGSIADQIAKQFTDKPPIKIDIKGDVQ